LNIIYPDKDSYGEMNGTCSMHWHYEDLFYILAEEERKHFKVLGLSGRIILKWFEVFMAVTTKNGVFWDVAPCGSRKNRHFGRT
jgi:hypothetical protein